MREASGAKAEIQTETVGVAPIERPRTDLLDKRGVQKTNTLA